MTDLFRKGLKRLAQEQLERVGATGLDELERHFLKGELSLREQDRRFMVPACESKKKKKKKNLCVGWPLKNKKKILCFFSFFPPHIIYWYKI